MFPDIFGSVDGENLVLRYEDMVNDGATPRDDVVHIPGLLVWHPKMTMCNSGTIIRMSYYQTIVGDADKLDEACASISRVRYQFWAGGEGRGSLNPRLFNKKRKGAKTKSVDINISVDVLRSVMTHSGDVIFLMSSDGDYLPLIEEVMRNGKQVWIAAFSKGLSPNLRYTADYFIDLDRIFFE